MPTARIPTPFSPTPMREGRASVLADFPNTTERLSDEEEVGFGSTHAHPALFYQEHSPFGVDPGGESRTLRHPSWPSPGSQVPRPPQLPAAEPLFYTPADGTTPWTHRGVAVALSSVLRRRRWVLPTVDTLATLLLSDMPSGQRAGSLPQMAEYYLEGLRNCDLFVVDTAPPHLPDVRDDEEEEGEEDPASPRVVERAPLHISPNFRLNARRSAVSSQGGQTRRETRPPPLRRVPSRRSGGSPPRLSQQFSPQDIDNARTRFRSFVEALIASAARRSQRTLMPPTTPPPLTGEETRSITDPDDELPPWRELLGAVQHPVYFPPTDMSIRDPVFDVEDVD